MGIYKVNRITPAAKFLKGEALSRQLEKCREVANDNHYECQTVFGHALRHAQAAGEALNEAKRLLGKRGKWTAFRTNCFVGSASTARNYMRVAKFWEDARVEKARAEGFTVNSIATFLAVISENGPGSELKIPSKTADEEGRELTLACLRRDFAEKIKTLTDHELNIMADAGMGYFWQGIKQDVRFQVCCEAEDDCYGEIEAKWEKLRERRRDQKEDRIEQERQLGPAKYLRLPR